MLRAGPGVHGGEGKRHPGDDQLVPLVAVTGLRPVEPRAAHALIVHDDLVHEGTSTRAGMIEQRAGRGDGVDLAEVVEDHSRGGLGEHRGRAGDRLDVGVVHGELVEELDHAQPAFGTGVDASELAEQAVHRANRNRR